MHDTSLNPWSRSAPLVTECEASCAPIDALRRLGTQGNALLESRDMPEARGGRSLLFTRPLVRLTIRGQLARFEAIEPAAQPLLADVGTRLGEPRFSGRTLTTRHRASPPPAAWSDQERLLAPSALDAVRVLASRLADVPSRAWIPAGVAGAFSYELVDHFEELPPRPHDPLDEPDANFVLASDALIWDHDRALVQVISRGLPSEPAETTRARHEALLDLVHTPPGIASATASVHTSQLADDVDDAFVAGVHFLLQRIAAGDVFQTVLSRAFEIESEASSLAVYAALCAANPSPYMFHLDLGDGALLGASPETFLRVHGKNLEVHPIAGTVPRGRKADGRIDQELDGRLALGLLLDPKEQAEHAMLLDLARNDVARVAATGTRRVVRQFEIEKFQHVQHLVSVVVGELRPGLDALHAYRAAANPGTLTGAPKVKAMELIRRTEQTARGFYGGACGYLLADGTFDSCIVIRSLRHKSGRFFGRAGAGIVTSSEPERELRETMHKSRSVLEAVATAGATQ